MVDFLWNNTKKVFSGVVDAADQTTSILTGSAYSTANLLKESVFLTGDIINNTASFTTDIATSTLTSTTSLLGVNRMITDVSKDYLVGYVLNNPDEATMKPLDKNLIFAASSFLLLSPLEKIRSLMINYHTLTDKSFTHKQYFLLSAIKKKVMNLLSPNNNISFNPKTIILSKDIINIKALSKTSFEKLNSLNLTQTRKRIYFGSIDCFFKELRNGGIQSFYKGALSMTIFKLIYFNLYDFRIKTIYKNLLIMCKEKNIKFWQIRKKASVNAKLTKDQMQKSDIYLKCLQYFSNPVQKIIDFSKNLFFLDIGLLTLSFPFINFYYRNNAHPIASCKQFFTYYFSPNKVNITSIYSGYIMGVIHLCAKYLLYIPAFNYCYLNMSDGLNLLINLISSMVIVEMIIYPLEFLKFRLMINNCSGVIAEKYSSIRNCVLRVYREENINGFYKGMGLKAINLFLTRICYLYAFDYYLISQIPKEEVIDHDQVKIQKNSQLNQMMSNRDE